MKYVFFHERAQSYFFFIHVALNSVNDCGEYMPAVYWSAHGR